MNKYQKAKSRCIKAYIRNVKKNRNVTISYKEAKRGFKYYSLIHDGKILPVYYGYSSEILIIDETPFETRYLGKFDIKEGKSDG